MPRPAKPFLRVNPYERKNGALSRPDHLIHESYHTSRANRRPNMADLGLLNRVGLDMASRTCWGEARGEPRPEGIEAVAWVIRNRVEKWPGSWWGSTVSQVCLKPFQFSAWNKNDPNYPKLIGPSSDLDGYSEIYTLVAGVMTGDVPDPTGGASHYRRIGASAVWANGRTPSASIGNHEFFVIGPSA